MQALSPAVRFQTYFNAIKSIKRKCDNLQTQAIYFYWTVIKVLPKLAKTKFLKARQDLFIDIFHSSMNITKMFV